MRKVISHAQSGRLASNMKSSLVVSHDVMFQFSFTVLQWQLEVESLDQGWTLFYLTLSRESPTRRWVILSRILATMRSATVSATTRRDPALHT